MEAAELKEQNILHINLKKIMKHYSHPTTSLWCFISVYRDDNFSFSLVVVCYCYVALVTCYVSSLVTRDKVLKCSILHKWDMKCKLLGCNKSYATYLYDMKCSYQLVIGHMLHIYIYISFQMCPSDIFCFKCYNILLPNLAPHYN